MCRPVVTASGWRSERGQTTTEWIMIAALLSAVGIAIFDIRQDWTIGGTLIFVTKSMFTFLRTMAP